MGPAITDLCKPARLFRHSVHDCSIYDMKPMSKQTRRDFLAMTTASAACLPFTKSFSLATPTPPREETPGGTVAVHLTTRDQRYSPSGSLTWQSADRARSEDTIILRGVSSKQPILGFGAAF